MRTGRDTPGCAAHPRPGIPNAYAALGARMIRETEIGLTYALRFPERFPRIPTIEVGDGAFDPAVAERYWAERLELEVRVNATPPGRVSI